MVANLWNVNRTGIGKREKIKDVCYQLFQEYAATSPVKF
jgi:hypothetical protein